MIGRGGDGLGEPLVWLFRPQFVSGSNIMFIAAIGLVVRAALGPVERLFNVLSHQHLLRRPSP